MERSRRTPQKPYPRTARLNALLHEVLAQEIERLSDADERLVLLTLTDVVCDPDLRRARVYFSELSAAAEEGLEEHRRALQATIGREVRMKRTPALAFSADPAVAAGARVEEALRRARASRPDPGEVERG